MPTEEEKAYVKKYKINTLLNELYTVLTQNKPDDPIQFTVNHFEAKLTPKSRKLDDVKISEPKINEMNNSFQLGNLSLNESQANVSMGRAALNRSISGGMALSTMNVLVF